mmetsp:Transcript_44606/g.100736  ORF Transcript_44606/g.100736 Transcript_44606/m.100736 type:complete len:190 (+) Transcript_44606:95-664(+)
MSYAAAKTRFVDIARRVFQSRVVIIGQLRGTNTPETNQMRFQLSKTGGSLKFIKNSMARVAAKEFPDRVLLGNLLHGKTILIYSDAEDPIATFKAAKKLEKEHDGLSLIGGALESTLLTHEGIAKAVELPAMDVVRGDLVGALIGPKYQLAQALEAPKMNTARTLVQSLDTPAIKFARASKARAEQLEE